MTNGSAAKPSRKWLSSKNIPDEIYDGTKTTKQIRKSRKYALAVILFDDTIYIFGNCLGSNPIVRLPTVINPIHFRKIVDC